MGREELLKLLPIPKLPAYLGQVDTAMKQVIAGSEFQKPITYVLQRGGKRLRPMLLIASAQLGGKKISQEVIWAAAAIELIHESSLIHDDIIDGDSQLELAQALLMGDYLIAAGLGAASTIGTGAVKILSDAIKAMAEGQAQQLTPKYKADTTDQFYIKTAKNKAGALFAAACQLGGLGSPQAHALGKYGETFGVAFQIIDDIVDGDFRPGQLAAARQTAQRYNSSAQKSLSKFPDSSLKWSLTDIPKLFLEVSLQ